MAFTHPFNQAQLQAANLLMELLNPKPSNLNELVLAFNQELENDKYEIAPIYEAIYQAGGEKIGFKVEIKNPLALLEKVQNLSWLWGAFLHFERHNWANMYKEIEKSPLLLSNIAQELKTYGLSLWTWQGEEDFVCGFISKAEDSPLIKKLSLNCAFPLEEI